MERLTKLGRVMGEEKVCCTHFDCIDEPEAIDEFYPYEIIGDEYFLSHEEAVAAAAVKEKPEVQE